MTVVIFFQNRLFLPFHSEQEEVVRKKLIWFCPRIKSEMLLKRSFFQNTSFNKRLLDNIVGKTSRFLRRTSQ